MKKNKVGRPTNVELKMRKNKKIAPIIILILLIGVGYAFLSQDLSMLGLTNVKGNTFNVYYDHININEGSVEPGFTEIKNSTTLDFNVVLEKPGDYLDFSVDVINGGTVDAMIESIDITGVEDTNLLISSITWNDGESLEKNQLLSSNASDKILIHLEYNKEVTEEELNELDMNDIKFTYEISTPYIQADSNAIIRKKGPKCKKATVLNIGSKGKYGSLVSGSTLKAGNAFDCDVKGNGNYTERFYYVSDYFDTETKSVVDDVAVLIYSHNMHNGQIDDFGGIRYNMELSSRYGPNYAYTNLPSKTEWPNMELYKSVRNILHTNNSVLTTFDYGDKVARLLAYKEIEMASGGSIRYYNTVSSSLYFLAENTCYDRRDEDEITAGYWLETPSGTYQSWFFGCGPFLNSGGFNADEGISGLRPVIEVEYKDLEF